MVRNVLLGVLIAVVLAVTGLNHYTTQSNLAYFTEANEYDNRQLVLIKAANDAQRVVEQVSFVATDAIQRLGQLEGRSMIVLSMVAEEDRRQETYIRTLTKILEQNKIAVPERPAPNAQPKQPARKRPQNRTASHKSVSVK